MLAEARNLVAGDVEDLEIGAPQARQAGGGENQLPRFTEARKMMNDAIDRHLGIRGYGLAMKLQKAGNVRDLHDLLPDFARALVRRIGIGPATPVVEAIERLITRP